GSFFRSAVIGLPTGGGGGGAGETELAVGAGERPASFEQCRDRSGVDRGGRVRAVRVHHRDFRAYLLFTSLFDPVAYPAAELVALYHERWELELTLDEAKTHTLDPPVLSLARPRTRRE